MSGKMTRNSVEEKERKKMKRDHCRVRSLGRERESAKKRTVRL